MQGYERLSGEQTSETSASGEEYVYPSFEQHMQELTARENGEVVPESVEMLEDERMSEADERGSEAEFVLADNPYSPYYSYEVGLKENNERFGESFAELNESVYAEYDKAAEDALRSSSEYWKYRSVLGVYGTDRENNTRHYHMYEDDGSTREIITPLRIDVGLDGKVANRDEFEPESLELYESMRAKETEAYVKSEVAERREMQALIQLNILNNGFTNHGVESAMIDTRSDTPNYQDTIRDQLAIDGDEAVIPPNPNGELSLTEYIDSVAESYDEIANEAAADFEEFENKFNKVSDTYLHSKNPIRSFIAGRKYQKMRAQYNSRLKELETINLYRSAANDLQQRLGRRG